MKRKYTFNTEEEIVSSKRSRIIYKVLKSELNHKKSRYLEEPISDRPNKKHLSINTNITNHCIICSDKLTSNIDIYECGHPFHKCCLTSNPFFTYNNQDTEIICPICNIYDVTFYNLSIMCNHLEQYIKKYHHDLDHSVWIPIYNYISTMNSIIDT